MNRTSLFALTAVLLCALRHTAAASEAMDFFGSGPNQFGMTFVPIGSPGNADALVFNSPPLGAVAYTYQISKFEVSEDMIAKFNASQSLTITKDTRGPNKPATNITWNEAARFVNWLNTSTGGFPAYKFTTGGVNDNLALWSPADTLDYDPANRFRSKRATYVLPSADEWFKAAYYDPNYGGPGVGGYWNYPTGSDATPTPVASGTLPETAVYGQPFAQGPADIFNAGGLSPFGVMALGGNAREWDETGLNLVNDSGAVSRGTRGTGWLDEFNGLHQASRGNSAPTLSNSALGFRVVSLAPAAIPEPSTYALVLTGLTALAWTRSRRHVTRASSL